MGIHQLNRANSLAVGGAQEEPAALAVDGDSSCEAAQDALTSEGGRAPPQTSQADPSPQAPPQVQDREPEGRGR